MVSFTAKKKFCAQPLATANIPMAAQIAQPPVAQPQPQAMPIPTPAPSAPVYTHPQQPTSNFQKPMAPVLIYT